MSGVTKLRLKIGSHEFGATLESNAAGRALAEMLPLTLTLEELNGNEKYGDLPKNLPTESFRPGTIKAGDILLWGSNTVVLFYETFRSSYSYTRLGKLDDAAGLANAVGSGSVKVVFERL